MKKSRVAFNFIYKDDHAPVFYMEINCHLIFDVKMDIIRKDRYVAGEHITGPT